MITITDNKVFNAYAQIGEIVERDGKKEFVASDHFVTQEEYEEVERNINPVKVSGVRGNGDEMDLILSGSDETWFEKLYRKLDRLFFITVILTATSCSQKTHKTTPDIAMERMKEIIGSDTLKTVGPGTYPLNSFIHYNDTTKINWKRLKD